MTEVQIPLADFKLDLQHHDHGAHVIQVQRSDHLTLTRDSTSLLAPKSCEKQSGSRFRRHSLPSPPPPTSSKKTVAIQAPTTPPPITIDDDTPPPHNPTYRRRAYSLPNTMDSEGSPDESSQDSDWGRDRSESIDIKRTDGPAHALQSRGKGKGHNIRSELKQLLRRHSMKPSQ